MTPSVITAVGFAIESRNGGIADLEPALRQQADIGADVVEIGVSSLEIISGGRVIAERAEHLARLTRSFPLGYTVHGLVASNFMDPDRVARQVAAAKAMLEICDRIGAKILVQHSGSLRKDQIHARAGADQRELDALGDVARSAERYGVRVAFENIFSVEAGEYRHTPTQVAAAVKTLNHPNVVALIDFSHAYIEATFRGLDLAAEIKAMAPVTGHLHVHDSFGQPTANTRFYYPAEATALGLGDLHLPLGWGDIAWREIFADLAVLPGTTMILEIAQGYAPEHAASLAEARHLAAMLNGKAPPNR